MAKKKKIIERTSQFEKLDNLITSNSRIVFWIILFISFIVSLLVFDSKVSIGGDDSGYIQTAYNFANGKGYPSWHGPFYCIFLAPFIKIFGVNVVFLKFISVVLTTASIVFLYKAFEKKTSPFILFFALFATAFSFLTAKYASTTYSEPFFIFLQSLFFYYFFKNIDVPEVKPSEIKNNWKPWVISGFIAFAMFNTRTVAIALWGAVAIYFLIEKRYWSIAYFFISTLSFQLILSTIKRIFWSTKDVGFESQLTTLMLKDPYKPDLGKDSFFEFIVRFWDNSNLYISKHFSIMLGFKPIGDTNINPKFTIAFYIIVLLSFIILFLRNRKLLFLGLYLIGLIGTTFIMIQKIWDQERLIMIYFPLILIFILSAIMELFKSKATSKLQFIPLVFIVIVSILIMKQTFGKISPELISQNFSKSKFSSYTPDWQNYMEASKWASDSLPKNAVVAVRKPEMSWIAGNGSEKFSGFYQLPTTDPDSLVALFKERKYTHVIMGNLRMNPNQKTERTINAVRRALSLYTYKIPTGLKLIKKFGTDEEAYIFEIVPTINQSSVEICKNLESAIIINPSNVAVTVQYGNSFLEIGDYENAIRCYSIPINYNTREGSAYFSRGVCYSNLKRYQEAIADFRKVVELDPKSGAAWYNLAVVLLNSNDLPGARIALNNAKLNNFNSSTAELEQLLN